MADNQSLFNLPLDPEEFGVVLVPADLRRLNFSALDFETLSRAQVEYIKTYFDEDFNDFVAQNGYIMLLENVAYTGSNIALRGDILNNENFISTALTEQAVSEHLTLIGQTFRRATPAVVDVEITVSSESPTAINIPAGISFSVRGSDGEAVTYELFRAPDDFTSNITIPAGKRGVVAHGIEGRFAAPLEVVSSGGLDQSVEILGDNIIDDPFVVEIGTSGIFEQWVRVDNLERTGPNDKAYEVIVVANSATVKFGDDIAGKAPLSGQTIRISYRLGGGIRGRIGSNAINETRPINPDPPASAAVEVLFRNPAPSNGGNDRETIESAKRRAPKEAAALGSAVTGEDYAQLASTYSHPVFGSVLKAVAGIKQGTDFTLEEVANDILAVSSKSEIISILSTKALVNQNIVEIYVLAQGPNNIPVFPSAGLRQGLKTFFEEINALTDEIRVMPGAIKPVNVTANVTMSRNADPGSVKSAVNAVISDFFNVDNFDMGEAFHLGNLYSELEDVPGVQFVTIFEPSDDIISTKELADSSSSGVGFNELITLGDTNISFYKEPSRR